jgi:hypothetical protein
MANTNYGKVLGGAMGLTFTVLFTGKVLGLGEVATWSWGWVTSPLWGPFVIRMGLSFASDIVTGLFKMTAKFFK